ncbi:hypothetical protein TNCV_475031 [Trichonephila clavipes]|nr:hypothetical protein TNCV_475031 [Trichonephila clavipes]
MTIKLHPDSRQYIGLLLQDPPYGKPSTAVSSMGPCEYGAFQAEWHQVVFSNESRFNLWDHDGRIRVGRYSGERCLPEYVI